MASDLHRLTKEIARLALTLALATTTNGAFAQSGGIKVADFVLANGLELVVIPDHRAPVVTHMIWYKVGAADETPGKSGLAHFLEHLMFKGTAKNPTGRFSRVVAPIGGQENAFTSNDYTGYFQRVPSEQLKTVMEFEADRMTGLVLTDAVVLPERNVILEEQNQRVANNPRARLGEQIDAALFLNHPYGKPVIGWRHEMEQLTAIVYLDPDQQVIVGYKDVQHDEFWVRGHMPDFPLLPGVLICEAAAQVCSYYVRTQGLLGSGDFVAFGGMDRVKFRDAVRPGDRLVMAARATDIRIGRRANFQTQGIVDGSLVFHGDIIGVPFTRRREAGRRRAPQEADAS